MKKIVKTLCPLIAAFVLCVVPILSPSAAHAGSSTLTVADKSSISSGIDVAKWLNYGQVKGKDGKIVFDDDVRSSGRLVATTKIQDYSDYGMEDIFNAEYTMKIDDIPTEEGNRFALAFGINDIEGKLGSTGSTEIYFVKSEDALKVGVSRFSENGEVKIAEPISVDRLSFGAKFTVNASLNADGVMAADISAAGGSKVALLNEENSPLNFGHSTEGYTVIGQNGKCTAEISSIKIKAFRYFNAETPLEITENFDNGHYNRNAFFSRALNEETGGYSGGCYVENGALKFDVLSSFISTVYRYSNFELTFDLVDAQREDKLDDNGNVLTPAVNNSWFGISIGAEENRGVFDNHVRGGVLLTMLAREDAMRVYNPYPDLYAVDGNFLVSYPEAYKAPEMQILNKDNAGRIYNYKVTMQDGKFGLWYKLSDSESFPAVPLVEFDLGYTPYGSVAIISYVYTGYTIDNIKIVNKDIAPKIVTITYEENGMKQAEDFKYTDTWSNEDLISVSESGGGCASSLESSDIAVIAAIIALGATLMFFRAEKRRNG